ncbi:MAG: acyltransferase family protein [Hyphomicrobiales bacterium]|nr:acyltransferase family protein [Hyphomicrobiales bacterium]
MKYRADIDGLRAVAVLPVVLFHAGVAGFGGGFVGVDVFFVISGYVITLRLLSDLLEGRFSIVDFYERRVRRIFPALFFMIGLTTVVATVLFLPPNFEDFSKSAVATALFASNIYFWKFSGYFEPSALLRPLLHTWSLAVEEQYYIFMPVAMFLVYRYAKARWLLVFLPGALLSFALSVYATTTAPTANFFLLPTRAWELLLGALLVLAPPLAPARKWWADAVGLAGLGLILYAVLTYTEETPFPGVSALAPCLGAALVIYSGTRWSTITATALSWKPLVMVGLLSYSLYLAHWPIAVFLRYATLRNPTLPESALIVAASLVLAWISWRFVEQPFRRRDNVFPRRRLFAMSAAAMAFMTAFGLAGMASGGFAFRYPDFKEQSVAGQEEWKERTCFLLADQTWRDWTQEDCAITSGHADNALLWGDSFAAHYMPGIVRSADEIPFNVIAYTAAGCPPILSYYSFARPNCQEFNRHALELIKQLGVRTVILSARWTSLKLRGVDEIRSTLAALRDMGVRTYLIGQSTEFGANVDVLDYRTGQIETAAWSNNVDPGINRDLKANIGEDATFVDPLAFLCRADLCAFKIDGVFRYSDFGHFSTAGATDAVRAYFPIVTNATAGAPATRSRG